MKLFVLVAVLIHGVAHASPETEIRASFDRYRKAILAKHGSDAAKELADETIRYYGAIRTSALVAVDLHAIPLADKILVLRTRCELTLAQISSMDGRAMAAHAIDHHWTSAAQVVSFTPGPISVTDTSASLALQRSGRPTSMKLVYRLERKAWHLALDPSSDAANLAAMRAKASLTEEDLAKKIVGDAIGHAVPESAWGPMVDPRR